MTLSSEPSIRIARHLLLMAVVLASSLGAAPPTSGTGTAAADIELVRVDVDAPLAAVEVVLGALRASASTGPAHAAMSELVGVTVDDLQLGEWRTTSSDPHPDDAWTLSLDTGDASVGIDLADYSASSALALAQAELGLLSAAVTTTPLDLTVSLGERGSSQLVTSTAATSVTELVVDGLSIELGDLLPQAVLDALPLQTLVDLAAAIGTSLPAGLSPALDDLAALLTDLADAEALAEQLQPLLAELAPLLAAEQLAADEVAVLEATIATLESDIATLEADLALLGLLDPLVGALQTQIAGLQAQLTQAEQDLVAAEQELADVRDLIAPLLVEVAALESQLTPLLEGVAAAVQGLPELSDLRLDLLGNLSGTPLLSLGRLRLGTDLTADLDGATSTTTCEAIDLRSVGLHLPSPSCAEVVAVVDDIEALIATALGALPTSAAPVPVLDGLAISESTSGPLAGATSASSTIEALRVELPSVGLLAAVDQLRADLLAALSETGASLDALDASVLGAVAPELLADVDTATAAVSTLETELVSLPGGAGLDGLRTIGLDVRVAGITSDVTFLAAAAAPAQAPVVETVPDDTTEAPGPPAAPALALPPVPIPNEEAAPTPVGEPGPPEPGDEPAPAPEPPTGTTDQPTPAAPAPAPDLPQTGGGRPLGALALLGAALALVRPGRALSSHR